MSSSGLRLGVVVNPTSGSGRGAGRGRDAVRLLEERGHKVVDLSADNLYSATTSARQGAISGLDALVVVGGDGMTHLGVNVVGGTSLPLGIIAAGTGNDVARTMGLPVHDPAASIAALEAAFETGGRVVDSVVIKDPAHSMQERFVDILCAGFDAAVNERANGMAWPKGRARYIRALVKELASFKPYTYKITVDGEVWESRGTLVAVANGPSIGGGIRIAPDALYDDGLLDVVVVGPVSRRELLRVFPQTYQGTHLSHPAVTVLRGREVLLEIGTDGGPVPPPAYADGERVGPLPLHCELIPNSLRLLAPVLR